MFGSGSRNIFSSNKLAVLPSRKFNSFFVNAEHKIRLQECLFRELQLLAKDQSRKFIYDLKERCYSVNPIEIMQDFFCHQHKSDTRMFFHAGILDRRNNISSIEVNVEDTGVAVIAPYASFRYQIDPLFPLLHHTKSVVLCKTFFSSRKMICYYKFSRYYRSFML